MSNNTLDIINNAATGGAIRFLTGTTNNTGTTDPATGATEAMRVTSAGNVGIGETNPQRKLTVRTDTTSTQTQAAFYNADTTDGNGSVFSFRGDTSGTGAATFQEFAAISGVFDTHDHPTRTGSLRFYTADFNGGADRMTILGNGRVGIGTDSPEALIESKKIDTQAYSSSSVDLTEYPIHATRRNTSGTNGLYSGIALSATGSEGSTTGVVTLNCVQTATSASSADFTIQTRKDGTFAERLRVDSSGNVGIGTNTPGELLHLSAATPAIRWQDTDVTGVHNIYANGAQFVISADQANDDAGSNISFLVDGTEAVNFDENYATFEKAIRLPDISPTSPTNQSNWGVYGYDDEFQITTRDLSTNNYIAKPFAINYTTYGTTFNSDSGIAIYSTTNGAGAVINFSDQAPSATQSGTLTYLHSDGAVTTTGGNSNDGWIFAGTETRTVVKVVGDIEATADAYVGGTLYTKGAGSLTPDATQPGAIVLANGGSQASPSTTGRGIEFLTADANNGYGHRLVSFDNTSGDTPLLLQRRNNAAAWTTQITFQGNSNAVNINGDLGVQGTLTATSKSFDIEHPTKPNHRLRYGSLEGPENGVYVRGRLSGTEIELPEYWTSLVDPDSITVSLTPIGPGSAWVEKIENNKITTGGSENCFYHVFAERVDIDKLVVEYENGDSI